MPRRILCYSRTIVRTVLRQTLLAILAAWTPVCCCQVRAAVQAAFHGDRGDARQACCDDAGRGCCDSADASPAEPAAADEGCCGGPDDRAPGRNHDCCAACKDRNPQMPTSVPVPDLAPELDAVATMLLADAIAAMPGAGPGRGTLARDTGPPPRPAGRSALALHSVLVI